ncbi:methyl-accepting chemotaxis protein [Asticcacaulis sp.]|uniref:methyl-accepting chemotaxis protein n=1 Tax=Asticcacaulis sp. TaxID=1872648 RepID=UPI003F7BCC50
MLKNMTIRVRVIAAFALVLCATVALGLFAIQRLSAVNASARDVGTNWLPAANFLGDLSQDFETYRSRQGQALLLTGEAREKMLARMQGSRDALEKDYASYNATVTTDEERVLADAIHSNLTAYYEASKPLEAATAANDVAGATIIYLTDMQAGTDALRKAIRDDRAYQLKEGHNAADKGIKLGNAAMTLIMMALAATAAICFGIGFMMIRTISLPITRMSGVMQKLADGDTQVTIPNVGERNEIGDMAGTVEVFRDNMIRNLALEEETRQAREDAEIQRKKTMYELADQFESAVGGVVEAVSSAATEMQATASQLTSSAQESAAQATSVSAAAEEAGTNVTSVAGSAEELGASVQEIGRQVEHSSIKAREAVREADSTAAIVQELSEAAARINGIVDMITGIAAQTNLLALNATIESARAGEAGKGFAVVAAEVKQLAQQTGKATSEISQHIGSIQSTTRRAVEAIENITGTIRDINDSSSTIAAAVEQQGAATSEIVQAVNQASLGTQEVTSNITGVARMAEETGAGAAQVLSASGELAHQAENLRTQINNFLAHIRAA